MARRTTKKRVNKTTKKGGRKTTKKSVKKTRKKSVKKKNVAKGKGVPKIARTVSAPRSFGRASAARSSGRAQLQLRNRAARKPKLLSGGNPQIAKGDGDAPVQAYISAMPGWKRDTGRRLDALIVSTVPTVRKAVKWNSPFYGIDGQGWFLSFHTFTNYVKVAFFRGTSLRPLPPGESKHKDVRYLDICEDDKVDETQLAAWIRQAAELPGWAP